VVVVVGSVISSHVIWQVIDVLVGILAIINIYSLFALRDIVIEEYKHYKRTD